VFLDLSDNYFEGPVPDDFEEATVLNSVVDVTLNGWGWGAGGGAPAALEVAAARLA
jgi:hypothetical protein